MSTKKTTVKKTTKERMYEKFADLYDYLLQLHHTEARMDISAFIVEGVGGSYGLILNFYPFLKSMRNRENFFKFIMCRRLALMGHYITVDQCYAEIQQDALFFSISKFGEDCAIVDSAGSFYQTAQSSLMQCIRQSFFQALDTTLRGNMQRSIEHVCRGGEYVPRVFAIAGLDMTKIKLKPAQLKELRELKAALVANTSI